MISIASLQFLIKLKSNNNKPWFDEHRKEYETLKKELITIGGDIIKEIGKFDASLLNIQPKDCIFRINRDIRFSKDKSPYKTNVGAYFSGRGKKDGVGGYYIHIEPGGKSFIGGGMYGPTPEQLKAIRQELDYNFNDFTKIVNAKAFKKSFNKLEGEKLVNPPKGYEANNPAAELLKHKSLYVSSAFTDNQVTDKTFAKEIAKQAKIMYPFLQFFTTAIAN
jgi:uncharacterized protein (TIGR02453 family)